MIISKKQYDKIQKKDLKDWTKEDHMNVRLYHRDLGHRLLDNMEMQDVVMEKGKVVFASFVNVEAVERLKKEGRFYPEL